MNPTEADNFSILRKQFHLAGRSLMIGEQFGAAGINLGYAFELGLKFLWNLKFPHKPLMKHKLQDYYQNVLAEDIITQLSVSQDFLEFVEERLNTRYPRMIAGNIRAAEGEDRAYLFSIDMLHCYDDLLLQLDDEIVRQTGNVRDSVGFRCCREIDHSRARLFFHCNDHAFERIEEYRDMLENNREAGDCYDSFVKITEEPLQLWNFPGMLAYRPWGPKADWNPARDYEHVRIENNIHGFRCAQWQTNIPEMQRFLTSAEFVLPKGKYEVRMGQDTINKDGDSQQDT